MLENSIKIILTPIDANNPCGRDVSFDYIVDQIRDAMTSDDADAPVGIWEKELKTADWNKAEDLCIKVLKEQSKDLQILFWLIKTWFNKYCWEGLNNGLYTTLEFCNKFGKNIFPLDSDSRINLIEYFFKDLSRDIVNAPLYKSNKNITYNNFRKINAENYAEDIKKTIEYIGKVLEKLENILGENITHIKDDLIFVLNNILELPNYIEVEKVEKVEEKDIEEKNVEEELPNEENNIGDLAKQEIIAPSVDVELSSAINNYSNNMTIDSALNNIEEVSNFLEKNFPQSPVPIILKIALKLKDKKFYDILKSENSEEPIINHISRLLNAVDKISTNSEVLLDDKFEMPNSDMGLNSFENFGGNQNISQDDFFKF